MFLLDFPYSSKDDSSFISKNPKKEGTETVLGKDKVNNFVKNLINFKNVYRELEQIKRKELILTEIKKLDNKIHGLEKDDLSLTSLNEAVSFNRNLLLKIWSKRLKIITILKH